MKHNYLKRVSSLLVILFFISCFFGEIPEAFASSISNSVMTEEPDLFDEEMDAENIETENTSETELDYVQDLADILTDEEEADLEENCISIGQANEIDIFILTANSVPTNRKVYIEDFYDANDNILTDAVILLVNMDPDNRGVEIQGYGQCEFSISDDRIEQILDKIVPFLSYGEYHGAFSTYIFEVDQYMSMAATSDYVHMEQDNLNYNENYYEEMQQDKGEILKQKTLFNLFIAAIAGAVSVIIMAINSKGKVTVNRNTYMDQKNSRILGHWDRYIRTTTTRQHKPKDNGSHGGGFSGGGGVSSGGHSHSGGGRSF